MFFKRLGDLVIVVHFLWIVFILIGLLLVIRRPRLAWLHLASLGLALVLNLGGWYCPLTYLENWLRSLHDPNLTYSGSFVIHWLEKIVYPALAERQLRLGALAWVGLNAVGYGLLFRKRRRRA